MIYDNKKNVTAVVKRKLAVLCDRANCVNRGYGRKRQFDEVGLHFELAAAGATRFFSFDAHFHKKEYRRLEKLGVKTVTTNVNADDHIVRAARRLASRGYDLIVVTGDADLGERIISAVELHNRRVNFWALRGPASARLRIQRYINDFTSQSRRNDWFWLNGALAAQSPSSKGDE